MFEDRDAAAARPLWLVREGGPRLVARDAGRRDARLARRRCASGPNVTRWRASRRRDGGAARRRCSGSAALAHARRARALAPRRCAGPAARAAPGTSRRRCRRGRATAAALGWAHGSYRFERYRTQSRRRARRAVAGAAAARGHGLRPAHVGGARDGARPDQHAGRGPHARAPRRRWRWTWRARCGAQGRVVTGDALREGFPAIHAVGRAAESRAAPDRLQLGRSQARRGDAGRQGRVLRLRRPRHQAAPQGMLLMKKDMGGAACVLALARMVMESALPVRLRVLIPAVENAIAGNAYRPGDVLRTRKGLTVEVGNTDAEGRLVLARRARCGRRGAIRDLLVDLATLTGAARVALGPELPALFGSRDETVEALLRHGRAAGGPAVADAAVGRLRGRDREQGRRPQQRLGLDLRRRDHRRAVPAPFRQRGARLAARRPLRAGIGKDRPGPPGRRRAAGRARAVRAAGRTLTADVGDGVDGPRLRASRLDADLRLPRRHRGRHRGGDGALAVRARGRRHCWSTWCSRW